jgi:hypothetical protein
MSALPPNGDFELPTDDRDVQFEKEEPREPMQIAWDPLNLSFGLFGMLLVWGVIPISGLTNFETIVTGGFFLYVGSRALLGFYVPLHPSLFRPMVFTKVLLNICTITLPILLITS